MLDTIFDSPELHELRRKNKQGIYERTPYVLCLADEVNYSRERIYIEELYAMLPASKQKRWLANFINHDDQQHLSAWFELMLYGWLLPVGPVDFEPTIEGENPDFSLNVGQPPIIVEARTFLKDEKLKYQNEAVHLIFNSFEQIKLPFVVNILAMRIASLRPLKKLSPVIEKWLLENPFERFIYEDSRGNCIVFEATKFEAATRVNGTYVPRGNWINSEMLKPALHEKAVQHSRIRESGYPYIIALLIEDTSFSTEEVFNAWIGKVVYTLNIDTREVIKTKNDASGLIYHNGMIRDQSVSGILIFHASWNLEDRKRILKCWYMENPFALKKVDWKLFPVISALEVKDVQNGEYQMGWAFKD